MKVILLSGYRLRDEEEEALGLAHTPDGNGRLLDVQIRQLTQMGLEVVCVVSGQDADRQLSLCPRIANTELVYDSGDQVSLASNLKAGLAAAEGFGCFALPVEILAPPADLWRFLNHEWRRLGNAFDSSVLQAVNTQGAPWHFGFPLVITRKGNELIGKLTDFHSLTDARLTYHHVLYPSESTLALPSKGA